MINATEDIDWAYWSGLAVNGAALFFVLFYCLRGWGKPKELEEKKETLHLHTAGCLALIAVMNATLAIDQGTTLRSDGIDAIYGRWAFMIGVSLLFGYQLGTFVGMQKMTRIVAAGSLGLATAAGLLTSISSEDRVWFHYSVNLALLVVFVLVVIIYPMSTPSSFGQRVITFGEAAGYILAVKILAILVVLPYGLFLGLGHSVGMVLGKLTEAWIYFGLDIFRLLVQFIICFAELNTYETLSPKRV